MALSLKLDHMKKIKVDGDHTTMRTSDGHDIVINHSALSKKHRKALEKLDVESDENNPKLEESKKQPPRQKMADGGEAIPFDKLIDKEQAENAPYGTDASSNNPQPQLTNALPSSDGSGVSTPPNPSSTPLPISSSPQTLMDANNAPATPIAQSVASAESNNTNQTPDSASPITDQTPQPGAAEGFKSQVAGIQGTAAATEQKAKADTEALMGQATALHTLQQHFNNANEQTQQTMTDFRNLINDGHIDPNHYLGSMSTGQRILSAIGVALGGLDPNGNQTLNFINSQINNDINAQKANMDKKFNLYKAVLEQSQDQRQATDMTRLLMLDQTKNLLEKNAAQATTPLAKAQAQTMLGQLQTQMGPLVLQQNMWQMLRNASQQPGGQTADTYAQMLPTLRITNPEMAKEIESRLVPGIGVSQVPVSEGTRDTLTKQATLIDATQRMENWIKQHGSTLDALSPNDRAAGETLALELQQRYRQGVGASTSEGEQNTINNIIGSQPLALIKSWNVSPKYKALKDSIIAAHNVTRRTAGLPEIPTFNPNAIRQWALQNPNNPNAQAALRKLGNNQ